MPPPSTTTVRPIRKPGRSLGRGRGGGGGSDRLTGLHLLCGSPPGSTFQPPVRATAPGETRRARGRGGAGEVPAQGPGPTRERAEGAGGRGLRVPRPAPGVEADKDPARAICPRRVRGAVRGPRPAARAPPLRPPPSGPPTSRPLPPASGLAGPGRPRITPTNESTEPEVAPPPPPPPLPRPAEAGPA